MYLDNILGHLKCVLTYRNILWRVIFAKFPTSFQKCTFGATIDLDGLYEDFFRLLIRNEKSSSK